MSAAVGSTARRYRRSGRSRVLGPATAIVSRSATTWLPDGNDTSLNSWFVAGARGSARSPTRSSPDVGTEQTCWSYPKSVLTTAFAPAVGT